MKLGILDAVQPEYMDMDIATDGEKFIDLLNESGFAGEKVVYNVGGGVFPATLADCDAYLISGSPASVYHDEAWIGELIGFVQAAHAVKTPMVGICFGHQVIAQALGGQVERRAGGWHLGLKSFELMTAQAWMEPAPQTCQIYHIHQDEVVSLPPEAVRIGQSPTCANSMSLIGNHIMSMQGHPEQPLRAMQNFIRVLGDKVPPETQAEAEISFKTAEPDRHMVAGWIRRFFELRVV